MERKPLLALLVLSALLALLVLSALLLLLVPLVSSVPVPRSLRLGNPPALKLASSHQEMAMASWNLGREAARMDVEVNDYQPSGPNNRHDPPKGPGRA